MINSNLKMEFLVNKENNSITVRREFAADVPLVWKAFTTKEILDQWWAPKPWKARTKSMEFMVGGHWHYAMVGPAGEEHWAYAKYVSINPEKSFTAMDAFADADGNINKELPQSKWESNFSQDPAGTLVVFEIKYDDLAQLEATIQMGFKEGLTACMEGLDEYFTNLHNAKQA